MSTETPPLWLEWVDALRSGDATAREELANYFTPFVHGALACHLAVHVANEQTKPALDDVLHRVGEVQSSAAFGRFLLENVRHRAVTVSKNPGATLELLGGGPAVTEGKKVLSKLRHLPEAQRERLVFRLLEGITGPEISEVTGAPEAEIRADLENGIAALVKEVNGLAITAAQDSYLWSLVGSPHTAIVPLENQLTGLRYDPSAPELSPESSGSGITPDVTPIQAPTPLHRTGEGRRATSPELKTVRAVDTDDEPGTTPIGVPLVEDPTRVAAGSDASAQESTRHATDLPIAAQENPFGAQPGTVPASDLPAAAGIDRARAPEERKVVVEETRQAPADPELPPPTNVRRPTGEVPAHPRRSAPRPAPRPSSARVDTDADTDSTAPRGVPLTFLARDRPEVTPQVAVPLHDEGQDWRTSVIDLPQRPPERPKPFSLTRGATPLVISGVLLVFFAVAAYISVTSAEKNVRRGWNLVPIVVAASNIPEGTVVDFDMISTRQVPEQFVTSSVVKPDNAPFLLNQKLVVPVQAGDPMLWSQFESAKANKHLSVDVAKKARAYTLESKNLTSVGGWVQPGDHVDLIMSMHEDGKKEGKREMVSRTLLQNIIVLATGKVAASTTLKPGQFEYTNVSLLVMPEEAEMLALMRASATYTLSLRNDEDPHLLEGIAGTSIATLMNGQRVTELKRKRDDTIKIIRSNGAKPVPAPALP